MSWYHFKFTRGGSLIDIFGSVLAASIVRFRYIWLDENSKDPTCKLPTPCPLLSALEIRFHMVLHPCLQRSYACKD